MVKEKEFDKLADQLRKHMDIKAIYKILSDVKYKSKF